MITAARSNVSVSESVLYVAFELGKKAWKLAMTSGFGRQPWVRPGQVHQPEGRIGQGPRAA